MNFEKYKVIPNYKTNTTDLVLPKKEDISKCEDTSTIPQKMTESLIALDSTDIIKVSEKASQLTAEELGWSASDFEPIILQLKQLSERAKENNKSLYHWMGL